MKIGYPKLLILAFRVFEEKNNEGQWEGNYHVLKSKGPLFSYKKMLIVVLFYTTVQRNILAHYIWPRRYYLR